MVTGATTIQHTHTHARARSDTPELWTVPVRCCQTEQPRSQRQALEYHKRECTKVYGHKTTTTKPRASGYSVETQRAALGRGRRRDRDKVAGTGDTLGRTGGAHRVKRRQVDGAGKPARFNGSVLADRCPRTHGMWSRSQRCRGVHGRESRQAGREGRGKIIHVRVEYYSLREDVYEPRKELAALLSVGCWVPAKAVVVPLIADTKGLEGSCFSGASGCSGRTVGRAVS